ncbi:MAG TPA: hypothetical protein VMU66_03685 [Gaiellales bacterium]|nr:hypothetical protein [Gaiellales bacterium]
MARIKRTSAAHLSGWLLLLAVMGGALAVTAYALTSSNRPVPPRRSLAAAVHAGLSGRPVAGVSADIALSDHLIPGSSTTYQVGPLAGATAHVWAAGGRVRVDLRSHLLDADIAFAPGRVTVLDLTRHVAYELPISNAHPSDRAKAARSHGVPTVAEIQKVISRLAQRMVVSGALPGDIAGHPAYTVRVSPRRNGGLIGNLTLAWDAVHGVPLRFAIYPRGSGTPAIDLTVTNIRYGPVPARFLTVAVPTGMRIQTVHRPAHPRTAAHAKAHTTVTGVAAVASRVGFKLAAPAKLHGFVRRDVRLVGTGSHAGALIVYGRGLGSVFVLEQPASGHSTSHSSSALPKVWIGGVAGRELETTLGTLVQYTRGGVAMTVFGSQPAGAIVAAAQTLG